jgi:hypothetical protein
MRKTAQLLEAIETAGLFDAAWYAAIHADVAATRLDPQAHFARFGLELGRWPCAYLAARLDGLDPALRGPIAKGYGLRPPPATGLEDVPADFDTAFYLQANSHIDHRNWRPYDHFMQVGWKDGRRPNPDFDVVWYEQTHGHTYDAATVNPLVHYREVGAALGNTTMPRRPVRLDPATAKRLHAAPSRACLFAGWDPEGKIDATVLRYLTDLARHADVFYLADCEMVPAELAKLDGIAKGAWAQRHGAYDMGSYSLLARDLVGWETLAEYDEVLLVNDSCYLVQPLAETLARMQDRPCAWWGMQATKGMAGARALQPFPAADQIPLAEIRDSLLDQFEDEPTYDFHIGTYFIALRREVVTDARFQRVLNAVRRVRNKRVIVRRYEVGLTRFLIGLGYVFDTVAEDVTRDHPVYSAVAFDLLEDGFPLLKRFVMAANPFAISATAYWEAQLPRLGSVTPVAEIAAHLARVVPHETLERNRQIMAPGEAPPPPLSDADFSVLDAQTPTYDHYWAFVTNAEDGRLSPDAARVLAVVADDPQRIKVVLTRGKAIDQTGHNIIRLPLDTLAGQQMLARCRVVFSRTSSVADLRWPLDDSLHDLVALALRPGSLLGAGLPALLAEIDGRAAGSTLLPGYAKGAPKTARSVVFIYAPLEVVRNRSRLFARLDGLRARGWVCYAMDVDHIAHDVLAGAEVVCCVGLTPPLDRPAAQTAKAALQRRDLIEAVRGAGGQVVYDADSPVADWPTFASSPQVQAAPLRANALAWHSAETAALVGLADGVTVATPALAQIMGVILHTTQRVCVLPSTLPASAMVALPRGTQAGPHLCCAAGTEMAAHDLAVALPGLRAALADHPDAVLHLVGAGDAALDLPAAQLRWHRPMPERARQAFLAEMDLNLMPLAQTDFHAACSAVPVLAPACQGVPTLASDLPPLRAMIDDGVTGDLVATPQGWATRLAALLADPAALRARGHAARDSIVAAHDPDALAATLSDFLADLTTMETRDAR